METPVKVEKKITLDYSIVLIGPTGVGKSTTMATLSKKLNCIAIDLDHKIEELTGSPINWIFDIEGEEGFRLYEKKAFKEALGQKDKFILATGAGFVKTSENIDLLRNSNAWVIYLYASPEYILKRIKISRRPLLNSSADPLKVLYEMEANRSTFYDDLADLKIDVSHLNARNVCEIILKSMPNKVNKSK